MQVKLLRVIQEKTVRPVGEQREAPVDVRILSATHKNLGELVGAGEVPRRPVLPHQRHRAARAAAARARRGHSRPGRRHPARGCRAGSGIDAPAVTPAALDVLQNFPFPGNVRELENMLERALALCNDGRIDVGRPAAARRAAPENAPPPSPMDIAAMRSSSAASNTAEEPGRPRARRPARGRRARRDRQGAGSGPLQQDRRGQGAGHDLSRTALSHQEARNRVTQSDAFASLCDAERSADVRFSRQD